MATDLLADYRMATQRVAWAGSALTAAAVGIALAAWGVLADLVGFVDIPLVQMFLLGGNVAGPWVIAAFVVGAASARLGVGTAAAAAWSAGSLVLADCLYYLGQVAVGNRSSVEAVASSALVWGVVAAGVGLALGAGGAMWARPDRHDRELGAVAVGVVAAVLVAEAVWLLPSALDVREVGRAGYALLDLAIVALATLLVAPAARVRYLQTMITLGVVGAVTAPVVLAAITSAIR